MISTIQPAGMVLIVKIIFMLITGTCFVNGQYFSVAGFGLPCFALQASQGRRVARCGIRVVRLVDARCLSASGGFDTRHLLLVTGHLSLVTRFCQASDILFIDV